MHRTPWATHQVVLGTQVVTVASAQVNTVQNRMPSGVRSAVPKRYLGVLRKVQRISAFQEGRQSHVKTSLGTTSPEGGHSGKAWATARSPGFRASHDCAGPAPCEAV